MSHLSATSRAGWAYSRSLTGHSYGDVQKLLVESGMWTISTTFAQEQHADDPGMVSDLRQSIAPPWENKRFRASLALVQAHDRTSAFTHLEQEESVVAHTLHAGGLILAGTDSPLDVPATSLHLNCGPR